jgi:hypothetical protein
MQFEVQHPNIFCYMQFEVQVGNDIVTKCLYMQFGTKLCIATYCIATLNIPSLVSPVFWVSTAFLSSSSAHVCHEEL